MQVLKLPAIAGLIWVSAGFRLLFQQALRMFSLIVMYLFAFVFVALLASIFESMLEKQGINNDLFVRMVVFFIEIFGPVLLIGYMQACRDIVRGERISPLYFLRGFQLPRAALLTLLAIGLVQVSALTFLLEFLPKYQLSDLAAAAANQAQPALTPTESITQLIVVAIILLVQVTFWYAPMLAAWHGMPIGKSMFFSLAACWRNKAAFFMFGIGWMIAGSFCFVAIALLLALLGKSDLAYALIAIILMLVAGAAYCSIYVTYSTVFVRIDAAAPETP